ncbi:MAG: DNA-processing protein DprA [Planctomycetes bacterium]|nr:DNA-processing protein DprA [Planctomycetota bacterium]
MDENGRYILALHLVSGLGAVTYRRLLSRFGTPEAILKAPSQKILDLPFLGEKRAQVIEAGRREALQKADVEIARAEKEGAKIATFGGEWYPAPLKSIYDPPLAVYIRGEVKREDAIAVGVVGTRRPSVYGRLTGEKFGMQLAARGFTVISGMAIGVDSAAHGGALKGRGRTIAVLGSGLDKLYPQQNRELAERIVEHGALVTELPYGTTPSRETFPRRNRLISGMSLGVVVVEGKENSGALITARFAMEQGREVFAVPGKIDDMRSRGPHMLIKQGAKLVEGIEDILDELGPVADFMAGPEEDAPGGDGDAKGRGTGKSAGTAESGGDRLSKVLNSNERAILEMLSDEPTPVDDIIAETGLAPAEAASHLMVLEIRRLIRQLPGKRFVREAKNGEEKPSRKRRKS